MTFITMISSNALRFAILALSGFAVVGSATATEVGSPLRMAQATTSKSLKQLSKEEYDKISRSAKPAERLRKAPSKSSGGQKLSGAKGDQPQTSRSGSNGSAKPPAN